MASTIASNSQKWIASQLSATAADGRPPRTAWSYVRDCNGMMVIDPVVGFYFNPPPNAKCRWSTSNGTRDAQLLTKGFPFPERTLILWDDARLEYEAARYREKYWDEMKTLAPPQRFEDLYEYFDSATLYISGVVNLWNLINLLANDARHNWREVERQVAAECSNWVVDWLEVLPGAASNRESLVKWDQKSDILTAVTSQFDWDNDLKALDLVGQNFLRESFLHHFERLTGQKPEVARFNTHAAENKPASIRSTVKPALGSTTKTSTSPNDVPLPPSPIQVLSTIPEESAALKIATKTESLTIDTGSASDVPSQTVSAPATAVPHIRVELQPAKEAEDVLEKNGRKDKTEDDFLSNQDLADRVQTTARQLSSQSTPGDRHDSMLNPFTNNIPPRAVSATETIGTSQHANRLQRTFPEKANTTPRNMYGNKPPFRGSVRSPQGHGPNRQQMPANFFGFSGERPALQQRDLSQQQHIIQPFNPPNNGMQPPPPGFNPPPSTLSVHSNLGGFPPPPRVLPIGVGMEQISGPPGMDYRSQMPTHQGQPPLGQLQAPLMIPPPQCIGQQNVRTPMYQPNGYIPQSQKQNGRDKGGKKKRPEDRRDSVNSNGSRSKVRDDPIHGPVYALKSSKHGNTPTRLEPSNSEGFPAIDPRNVAPRHMEDCENNRLTECHFWPPSYFVDCSCPRCLRSSRSLFVKHGELPEEQVRIALLSYMRGWGAGQVVVFHNGSGSLVIFNSDNDAVRALRDLLTKKNKAKDIPGMGKVTSIWYAWYSKHYTHPHSNPTGMPRRALEDKGPRRRSSSTLSRDSNPYRNYQPNNTQFNTVDFTNFGPGQQQPFWAGDMSGSFYPSMVPVLQEPTQRVLWSPSDEDRNRKPNEAATKPKQELEYQPKTHPRRPNGATALKEDWRSKPPAEEVIEDISSDEATPADTSSNISSQGARGIKVCLPNEAGSLRSRSVSPTVDESSSEEQVLKNTPESRGSTTQGGDLAESGTVQDVQEGAISKVDGPTSSGYRKAAGDLAVSVETLQPAMSAEQVEPAGEDSKNGLTSYSKVASELTGAAEDFDINTVIRHKAPRSPLPKEWMTSPEKVPSNLQDRLGALNGALQLEALGQQASALPVEGASPALAPESPKVEPAPAQTAKSRKFWTNKEKGKRTKSKVGNGTSSPTASSATLTEAQSRGASQAPNERPVSRTSNGRPDSSDGMGTRSPDRSRAGTKRKKNNKWPKKRKQPSTAEPSAAPPGQTRATGSQAQDRAVSVKESPAKKSKTQHTKPASETQVQSALDSVDSSKGSKSKPVVNKHDDSVESNPSQDATGSMRVEKGQCPQKPSQLSDCGDEKETLQKLAPTDPRVVLDVPTEMDHNNYSPEANLFPNQKFTIDKVKRDSAMAAPPTANDSDVCDRQPSAMRFPAKDARIALPLLPPNSKPSGWVSTTSRVPRSKSDDPFTSAKGEPQPEDWLKDKAVKTPRKPSSAPGSRQTSPTPSPEKGSNQQAGRSRLNAAAKSFEPSSIPPSPTMSVASVLPAQAIPSHKKKPSLPGHKVPAEQRLVTPAEQVVDPSTVTQPGPPTKEKKRVGSSPDRNGKVGQKGRVKSVDTVSGPPAKTKTAAQVASVPRIVSKLEDEDEFPTLAAAAAVLQRRASCAVKASEPAGNAASNTSAAAAPNTVAAPKPPVTPPSNTKQGQRGDATAPIAEQQSVDVGPAEKNKTGEKPWTTVGAGKRAGGKKNSNGNNSRSTSGKSSGGATEQSGKAGGQGARGGKVPVGEERKGG